MFLCTVFCRHCNQSMQERTTTHHQYKNRKTQNWLMLFQDYNYTSMHVCTKVVAMCLDACLWTCLLSALLTIIISTCVWVVCEHAYNWTGTVILTGRLVLDHQHLNCLCWPGHSMHTAGPEVPEWYVHKNMQETEARPKNNSLHILYR